jgi:hypothetical protein
MSAENFETDRKSFNNKSLEKGPTELDQVAPADDRYHFDKSDLDRVQRRLKQRHVQMLALFIFHMNVAHPVDISSVAQDCCPCPPLVVDCSRSLTIFFRLRGPLERACSLGLGLPCMVRVPWVH